MQLSLDATRPGSFHYALARALRPLRDEGVLVLASGNIVHNLRLFDFRDPQPLDWAVRCDDELRRAMLARDHVALMSYAGSTPQASLAVPTPEHYHPLLYALALQGDDEPLAFFNCAVMSSISMTSVMVGVQPAAQAGVAAVLPGSSTRLR